MLKRTAPLLFALALSQVAFGQKPTAIYYFKGNYVVWPSISGADYILLFYPPDSAVDKDLFIVKEYYNDGNLRFESRSKSTKLKELGQQPISGFSEPVLEGGYVEYFHNGKRKTLKNFENGKPSGAEMDFYPNGKLYRTKTYVSEQKSVYVECRDSSGKVLVEDGNGTGIDFLEDNFKDYLSGLVVNGLEEGKWTGKQDSVDIIGTYEKGELKLLAEADTSKGEIYFKPEVDPEFPGGVEAFYKYLGHNVRYPKEARDANQQGIVIIKFIINSTGTITEVQIAKSLSSSIDAEAVRVMQNCPKWKPGMVKGKPVNVRYSVPISFTLSTEPF